MHDLHNFLEQMMLARMTTVITGTIPNLNIVRGHPGPTTLPTAADEDLSRVSRVFLLLYNLLRTQTLNVIKMENSEAIFSLSTDQVTK